MPLVDLDAIPFVQAHWYYPGRRAAVRFIVVHDMEAPELLSTAEATANYFAGMRDPTKKASAHYSFDADSTVCSVHPMDTAFHAPGVNTTGIGLEHAGYARQSYEEWLDDFGRRMLGEQSAPTCAALCVKYDLPARYLTPDEILLPDSKGIITHWGATMAFKVVGGHTDPGSYFPMDWYVSAVNDHMSGVDPAPVPLPEEVDVPPQTIVTSPGKPWFGLAKTVDPATGRCPHWFVGESDKARIQRECDLGAYDKAPDGTPVVKNLSPADFALVIG